MTRAGTIPLSDIERIQIYVNKSKYKESQLSTILKATGGDMIFNGTIFSWNTYKPVCPTKADGVVLCTQNWKSYGLSWNSPADFAEAVVADAKSNYICCVPLIIAGKKKDKPVYQPDMGGSRPRTAIGVKGGKFAYFVTSTGYTPEKLRDLLYSSGWSHATMLDGGGSTCFRDASGGFTCDASRRVQHYIIIHKKKGVVKDTEQEGAKPMNIEIKAYSLKKEGGDKLSAHFKVKEFACPDGSDTIFNAPKLMDVLEKIREKSGGKPVNVSKGGGYRNEAYNRAQKDATYSQHMYGTAADISIAGVEPKQIGKWAREIMPNYGGIGIYGTFCHVDVRDTVANWNG